MEGEEVGGGGWIRGRRWEMDGRIEEVGGGRWMAKWKNRGGRRWAMDG